MDHCFFGDCRSAAITQRNCVLLSNIDGKPNSQKLFGHEQTVTGVDIAPQCNLIVTCGQDRNAYVWEPFNDGWKPTLVLLRLNRSATVVRWSPSELKFAVGSCSGVVAVCHFEKYDSWWISKHIKDQIHSSVTSISWHPDNSILATGSTDGFAKLFGVYLKSVDLSQKPNTWVSESTFGAPCGEYSDGMCSWVRGVAFSPSGNILAFTTHSGTVVLVITSAEKSSAQRIISISVSNLAFHSLAWADNDIICLAGLDMYVYYLIYSENKWELVGCSAPESSLSPEDSSTQCPGLSSMSYPTRCITAYSVTEFLSHSKSTSRIRVSKNIGAACAISASTADGRIIFWPSKITKPI